MGHTPFGYRIKNGTAVIAILQGYPDGVYLAKIP